MVPFRFPLQAQYAVGFSHLRLRLILYVHYVFQYLKTKGESREVDKRSQLDRQLTTTYRRNIEARTPDHCCRRKTISVTYCECVCVRVRVFACVALISNMPSACAVLSLCGFSGCTIFFHITYLITSTIFGKKVIEHKVCVLIFSTSYMWNILIWRRTERDMTINVRRSSCRVSVILVRF